MLGYLDTRYLIKHLSGYTFQFDNLTKISTKTRYVMSCHVHVITMICIWIYKIEAQLLLSFIHPHEGVTTQTIFR